MASAPTKEMTEDLRASFEALIAAVRETTPSGARPVPALPSNFNMLARPHHDTCQVCGLPGHTASNIYNDNAMCRAGILSTIGFWEELWKYLDFCFHNSDRFQSAINKLIPRYEMRPESSFPPVPGDLEVVLADHLAKHWIHFLAYCSRMKPKLVVLLGNEETIRFEEVVKNHNWLFLGGVTCRWLCFGPRRAVVDMKRSLRAVRAERYCTAVELSSVATKAFGESSTSLTEFRKSLYGPSK